MDDLEDFVMQRLPTAERPLLGLTLLVVEDSRFACEAIRLMCLRSGARIRRADSLRAAAKHLKVYRPSVVIVDLGLPDGSGLDLIEELAGCVPRVDVIIGTSGDPEGREAALRAGVDGFLEKPLASLAAFQECILQHLPQEVRPKAPRALPDDIMVPDQLALKDDLAHVVDLLDHKPEDKVLDYVAQFLGGVAISSEDTALLSAARALDASLKGATGGSASALSQLNSILKARLSAARLV